MPSLTLFVPLMRAPWSSKLWTYSYLNLSCWLNKWWNCLSFDDKESGQTTLTIFTWEFFIWSGYGRHWIGYILNSRHKGVPLELGTNFSSLKRSWLCSWVHRAHVLSLLHHLLHHWKFRYGYLYSVADEQFNSLANHNPFSSIMYCSAAC